MKKFRQQQCLFHYYDATLSEDDVRITNYVTDFIQVLPAGVHLISHQAMYGILIQYVLATVR